jgi:hypothetical protein
LNMVINIWIICGGNVTTEWRRLLLLHNSYWLDGNYVLYQIIYKSLIPLACAEYNYSLTLSGASSIVISVRGWVNPGTKVRPGGCQWKNPATPSWIKLRDLPVCSAVPQPLHHRVPHTIR